MAITGNLKNFSIPELFQFIHQGRKTGLLTIRTQPITADVFPTGQIQSQENTFYYIWVNQGGIVAFSKGPDSQDLISAIIQRGWLKNDSIAELMSYYSVNTPIGLYLKQQGILQVEQLKLLFHAQVVRPVCALFRIENGQFKFNPEAPLPTAKMTGLHLPADEATLLGLRVLRDWSPLNCKLPNPTSLLSKSRSVPSGKPPLNLDSLEWQVWEFVTGTVSLETMAEQLRFPIQKIQEIAFRLILVGLVEEIPVMAGTPNDLLKVTPSSASEQFAGKADVVAAQAIKTSYPVEEMEKTKLSTSFLNNLVSFLKNKVSSTV